MIGGGFHWPTAALVIALALTGWAVAWLWRRQRRGGFVTDVDRATYATLHTASLAAVEFGQGLNRESAARAARHVRTMLGTPAVAVCDLAEALTWDGAGEHHLGSVMSHANDAISAGRTVVARAQSITCAEPDCVIRSAIISPLVVDERVVGALCAYGMEPTSGLARATEEVARYVSSQLEVAEVGRERTRAMEAELRALRAQISPHFIYNSLAAIASFVRTDPERARDLLLEFADFTRYALRRGGAFTTLAEELRNVDRYLVLEQARFGERLSLSLLIAPEVLPVTVPYLVVQPLVENAVRHGLAPKEGVGHLTITAQDRGAMAEIVVEDDGVGADPDLVRALLDGDTDRDSVGLGNVDARLRQVYGDEFGLVVETAPGAGTRIVLTVPKFSPNVRVDG